MNSVAEKIAMGLEAKLQELGVFIVDVRQIAAQQRIEVYLDRDAGKPGIDIDTCAEVSRYLQFQLDHQENAPKQYVLEVSSPGMDNPFKVLRQYHKYKGSRVEVLLMDGRKLDGILVDADESGLVLDQFASNPSPASTIKKKSIPQETERTRIDFQLIKSTKRKFEF